jgi:hypothetical protein
VVSGIGSAVVGVAQAAKPEPQSSDYESPGHHRGFFVIVQMRHFGWKSANFEQA